MSRRSEAVIAAFEKLPPAERVEVVTQLLRRVALTDHSGPSEEDLTAEADEVFRALDELESEAS